MKAKIFKNRKSRLSVMIGVLFLQLLLLRSCSVKDDFLLPFDPDIFMDWSTLESLLLLLLLVVAAVGFVFLFGLLIRMGAKAGMIMLAAALVTGGLLADPAVQKNLAPKPAASKVGHHDDFLMSCGISCFDGGGPPAAAPAPVVPPAAPAPAPGGGAGA